MGVDHGRGYVAVPQEFLHSANIISGFQQMSSKTVSEGLAARRFINRCGTHRVTNGILEISLGNMMPASFAATRVERDLSAGKSAMLGFCVNQEAGRASIERRTQGSE